MRSSGFTDMLEERKVYKPTITESNCSYNY